MIMIIVLVYKLIIFLRHKVIMVIVLVHKVITFLYAFVSVGSLNNILS